MITGDEFTLLTDSAAGTDTRFWVYAQTTSGNAQLQEATVQSLEGDDRVMITLPSNLLASSMYFVWAENDAGVSRPIAINQTEAWWIGPDATAAGETISIFGRNLSMTGADWELADGGEAPAWIWLETIDGAEGRWATVTKVDPYRVDFLVPENFAVGQYRAWVHNGHGGEFGWGEVLEFEVRSAADNGTGWSDTVITVTGLVADDVRRRQYN